MSSPQIAVLEAFNEMLSGTSQSVRRVVDAMGQLETGLGNVELPPGASDGVAAIERRLDEGLEAAWTSTRALQQAADDAATGDLTSLAEGLRTAGQGFAAAATGAAGGVNSSADAFTAAATSAETALTAARDGFVALKVPLQAAVTRVLDDCVVPLSELAAELRRAAAVAATAAAGHESARTDLGEAARDATLTVDRANQKLIDHHEDLRTRLEALYDKSAHAITQAAATLREGLAAVIAGASERADAGVALLGEGLDGVVADGLEAFLAELVQWAQALDPVAEAAAGLPEQVAMVRAARAVSEVAREAIANMRM